MAKRIILLGPPGAGKGTHAKFLSERYNLPHISTGDILRARIKDGSSLGEKAKAFVESGQLVPDSLVIEMVAERLKEPDTKNGFILDGFPRTVEQAEALGRFLEKEKQAISVVIDFDTSEETIIERLAGRRACSKCTANYHIKNVPPKKEGICDRCGSSLIQRKDDNEATVRNRLKVYHDQTAPLIDFYKTRGLLKQINGNLKIETLQAELFKLIDPLK